MHTTEHQDTTSSEDTRPSLAAPSKTLVLVGLMGVGKTTVGRRLASALELAFEDCDDAIEAAAGMTVSEIFDNFGEEEFRRGERRVIERLITGEPKVIATGGGAFINDETRALIKEHGISIWLDADIETLAERTGRRDHRPLLRGVNRAKVLEDLMEKRRPFYAQADLKVESTAGPHGNVVQRILDALKVFGALKRDTQS